MKLLNIKGIGEKTLSKLESLEIFSIDDLIGHFPRTYFDMTKYANLDDVNQGDYVLIHGVLTSIGGVFRKNAKLNFFAATLEYGNKKIKLTWFNAPFLHAQLEKEVEYNVWGKINIKDKKLELFNPNFEKKDNVKRLQGIVPIYSLHNVIAQTTFRKFISGALENFYCQSLLDKYEKLSYVQTLEKVHFPTESSDIETSEARLAEEELVYQLLAYKFKKKCCVTAREVLYQMDISVLQSEISTLPYQLTESQKKALEEIICGLKDSNTMNRMLIGDVGSGKTIVAVLAMLFSVKNGKQACFMAPTEILAQQHFKTCISILGTKYKVELLSASVGAKQTRDILSRLENGEIDILIGTHSVIGEKVKFKKLGFIVIDELHKFGVGQKCILKSKSQEIDSLIMSATPIPRTLALQVYGDLEMSTLEAREGTGGNIETFVVGEEEMSAIYKFIFAKIAIGEQAYIVCPLVEDGEGIEVYSAKTLYKKLTQDYPKVEIGLLYGKQKEAEKSAIMQNFYDGKIKLLIATTVIEVGIDCQNATIICVLNADRFGLASLHQLRGRVGRKKYSKAYCFLQTAKDIENQRLIALKNNNDAWAIAEIDAQLRGYGDFLGIKQSGCGTNSCIDKNFLIECKLLAEKITLVDGWENDKKLAKYVRESQEIALL